MTILWRPPSTRPRSSQALRMRLTVCSVVPVISATSWREIGKSICTPDSTLRPPASPSAGERAPLAAPPARSTSRPLACAPPGGGSDGLRIDRERRVFDQARPCSRRPDQGNAVDHLRQGRVCLPADRHGDAEDLARVTKRTLTSLPIVVSLNTLRWPCSKMKKEWASSSCWNTPASSSGSWKRTELPARARRGLPARDRRRAAGSRQAIDRRQASRSPRFSIL